MDSEPHVFCSHPRYLGELCYALGLGSLVPVGGFVILFGGEALRVSEGQIFGGPCRGQLCCEDVFQLACR